MGILSKKKSVYKRINPEDEESDQEDIPIEEIEKVINQSKGVVEEEKPKERFVVVKELPMREIRTTKTKEGTILHIITIEEALSEIINS